MGGALIGTCRSVDPARTRAGPADRVLNVQLDKSVRAAPGRLALRGPAEGRDRREVPRRHARARAADVGERGDRAALPHGRRGRPRPGPVDVHAADPGGVAASTIGFSDALAGRGRRLGQAIGAFVPLVKDLTRSRAISPPQTDLAASSRARIAQRRARPGRRARRRASTRTSTRLPRPGRGRRSLPADIIASTPPAFQTLIDDSPRDQALAQRHRGAVLRSEARASRRSLAAPRCSPTPSRPAPTLPGTAALDRRVVSLGHTLGAYSAEPDGAAGPRPLDADRGQPRAAADFLTPAQSSCNYVTLFLRNTASAAVGPRQRPERCCVSC